MMGVGMMGMIDMTEYCAAFSSTGYYNASYSSIIAYYNAAYSIIVYYNNALSPSQWPSFPGAEGRNYRS